MTTLDDITEEGTLERGYVTVYMSDAGPDDDPVGCALTHLAMDDEWANYEFEMLMWEIDEWHPDHMKAEFAYTLKEDRR